MPSAFDCVISMPQLTEEQMKRSQNASIKDGALWAAMTGTGDSFIQAFAVKLGASTTIAVMAVALPQLVASLAQLASVPLSNRLKSRKPYVGALVFLQRLLWLPIALVAFAMQPHALAVLIALYCAYVTLGTSANPVWSSWMAEVVPEKMRGEFFSRRNKIMILIAVASAAASGFVLEQYLMAYHANDASHWIFSHFYGAGELGGFALLFLIAFALGMASLSFLLGMDDVPYAHEIKERIGVVELLGSPAQKESRVFASYIFLLMFGTFIGAPFIAIYMLTSLKFDLFTFSLIAVAASIAKFLTLPYWGKLADRFGPRAVFITCGLLIPLVAVYWAVFTDPHVLFVSEMLAGVAWGGFELACFNFVLGRAEREQRAAAVAVYNLSKGAGVFAGSLAGILLFRYVLPAYSGIGSAFVLIFFISAAMRLAASAVFLPRFKEESFGGMGMGHFLWHALAVNPSLGVSERMSRTFSFGLHMAHSGMEYGGKAARGGLDLAIYMLKRGPVMIGRKIKLKKGL